MADFEDTEKSRQTQESQGIRMEDTNKEWGDRDKIDESIEGEDVCEARRGSIDA